MDLDSLLNATVNYRPMVAGDFALPDVYGFGEGVAKRINMSPVLDLHDLIRGNGGDVHYIDYQRFRAFRDRNIFEKSIYVHDEQKFDIILPTYAPLVENRYTMAHELAHYVLHSKDGKCFACRNGGGTIEKEADCFALGFLMPSEQFRAAYLQYHGDPNELSIAFLVSADAVNARIRSLNLIQK